MLVEPLARERVWLASDTGRSPDLLAKDFPTVSGEKAHEDSCQRTNLPSLMSALQFLACSRFASHCQSNCDLQLLRLGTQAAMLAACLGMIHHLPAALHVRTHIVADQQ